MLRTDNLLLYILSCYYLSTLICLIIKTLTSLSLYLPFPPSHHIQGFLPSCSGLHQKNTSPRLYSKPALHQCSMYHPALQRSCSSALVTRSMAFSCLLITLFKHHNRLTKLLLHIIAAVIKPWVSNPLGNYLYIQLQINSKDSKFQYPWQECCCTSTTKRQFRE